MRAQLSVGLAIVGLALCARGEEPAFPETGPDDESFSWLTEMTETLPALKHARGDRWPMVVWDGVGYEPLSAEAHKAMLARGLVQHIRLDEKMIPAALALQQAGAPVIVVQGMGGAWPANLAGEPSEWAHQLPAGQTNAPDTGAACPGVLAGWGINADKLKATLRAFKAAGVTIDAMWMDWEVAPMWGAGYAQAAQCARCRATLPRWALASEANYRDYCWQLAVQLIGAYLAAPVREIFPKCSLTNWHLTISTPERPIRSWGQRAYPPVLPILVTAANPVAYGNTVFFSFWKKDYPLDREHVDQFYTHLLLREVSDNEANARQWAPYLDSVPWVDRWCPDEMDPKIPIISRERYRECLRHMWLRGVDAMQIFQPGRKGYLPAIRAEVEDAVAIYDEVLEYRDFLDDGEVLCTDVPGEQDDGVLWSGLRLSDRAVVRAFKQGGGSAKLEIEPWPGRRVTLEVPPEGRTWVVSRVPETEVDDVARRTPRDAAAE